MGIFQLCNAPAAYVAAPKERQLCVGGRWSIVLGMVSNSLKEGRLRIDEWLHISIGHLVKNLNWAHCPLTERVLKHIETTYLVVYI